MPLAHWTGLWKSLPRSLESYPAGSELAACDPMMLNLREGREAAAGAKTRAPLQRLNPCGTGNAWQTFYARRGGALWLQNAEEVVTADGAAHDDFPTADVSWCFEVLGEGSGIAKTTSSQIRSPWVHTKR